MGYLLLLFTLALVGCDHATKAAAQAALGRRGPVALVPGILDLHYAENRDTAFSLLHGVAVPHKGALLVTASAIGLLAVAIAWWRRRRSSTAEQAAFALLLAGAAGNAIDRARAGFVVDFIEIHHWPIFNVADVAIVAGIALLAISGLRRRGRGAGGPPAGGGMTRQDGVSSAEMADPGGCG
jgi:signal peptidase II